MVRVKLLASGRRLLGAIPPAPWVKHVSPACIHTPGCRQKEPKRGWTHHNTDEPCVKPGVRVSAGVRASHSCGRSLFPSVLHHSSRCSRAAERASSCGAQQVCLWNVLGFGGFIALSWVFGGFGFCGFFGYLGFFLVWDRDFVLCPFINENKNLICIGASCRVALAFHGMYFSFCLISLINRSQPPVLFFDRGLYWSFETGPLAYVTFCPSERCELAGLFIPPKHRKSMQAVPGLGVPGAVLVAGCREDSAARRPDCWFEQGQRGEQRWQQCLGMIPVRLLLANGVRVGVKSKLSAVWFEAAKGSERCLLNPNKIGTCTGV